MESDILEMFTNNDKFNSKLQETLISIVKANDVTRQEIEELKDSYSTLKKAHEQLQVNAKRENDIRKREIKNLKEKLAKYSENQALTKKNSEFCTDEEVFDEAPSRKTSLIQHDEIADSYENIENYATVPINLSSSIIKDPVSKQCITLATNLEKFKEDFDAFQIQTNRENDLRNREIKSKEKWVKGHEMYTSMIGQLELKIVSEKSARKQKIAEIERLHVTDHEAIKVEILELQKLVQDDCHADKEIVNLKIMDNKNEIGLHSPRDDRKKSKSRSNVVFGSNLEDVPKFLKSKSDREKLLPEFLAKAIRKINTKIETVGIYRVNGDTAEVEKLKKAVNENRYDIFNACEDVSTLTSLVKLYLREIPGRLINSDVIEYIKSERVDLSSNGDKSNLIYHMRKSLEHIERLPSIVLHFVLLHAKHVSDVSENKMDTNNVAIVLAPNLVSSPSYDADDYSQILTEMEITNRLVELLIINVNEVF